MGKNSKAKRKLQASFPWETVAPFIDKATTGLRDIRLFAASDSQIGIQLAQLLAELEKEKSEIMNGPSRVRTANTIAYKFSGLDALFCPHCYDSIGSCIELQPADYLGKQRRPKCSNCGAFF